MKNQTLFQFHFKLSLLFLFDHLTIASNLGSFHIMLFVYKMSCFLLMISLNYIVNLSCCRTSFFKIVLFFRHFLEGQTTNIELLICVLPDTWHPGFWRLSIMWSSCMEWNYWFQEQQNSRWWFLLWWWDIILIICIMLVILFHESSVSGLSFLIA